MRTQRAFPLTYTDDMDCPVNQLGMMLRDWFAGQALIGLLTYTAENVTANPPAGDDWAAITAIDAYKMADAMMEERLNE